MLSFQPEGVWQVLSWRDGIDEVRGEKFCLPFYVGNLESYFYFLCWGSLSVLVKSDTRAVFFFFSSGPGAAGVLRGTQHLWELGSSEVEVMI